MNERPQVEHPSFESWWYTDRNPLRRAGVPSAEMASSSGTTRRGARRFPPRHPRELWESSLQLVEKHSLQPYLRLRRRIARKDRYGCWICSGLESCGLDFFCRCCQIGFPGFNHPISLHSCGDERGCYVPVLSSRVFFFLERFQHSFGFSTLLSWC